MEKEVNLVPFAYEVLGASDYDVDAAEQHLVERKRELDSRVKAVDPSDLQERVRLQFDREDYAIDERRLEIVRDAIIGFSVEQ